MKSLPPSSSRSWRGERNGSPAAGFSRKPILAQKFQQVLNICLNICFVLGVVGLTSACGARPGEITRIGVLAPFEGRYREVGYNAYYAAKLAIRDWGNVNIELLAVDDGGTVNSAVERAKALAIDPLVKAVIVLGYPATDTETQAAYGDLPVLVVGDWGTKRETESIFILSGADWEDQLTTPPRIDVIDAAAIEAPVIGGEMFGLMQFPKLRDDLTGITAASSGALPNEDFRERYLNSAEFAPEPGLLATLTYDATSMALQTIHNQSRMAVGQALAQDSYSGLNGVIQFEGGYWTNAPTHYYAYDENNSLIAVDRPVE
jgi:ABC-type branched-subunit amino acid transport system substrate-binding protein